MMVFAGYNENKSSDFVDAYTLKSDVSGMLDSYIKDREIIVVKM